MRKVLCKLCDKNISALCDKDFFRHIRQSHPAYGEIWYDPDQEKFYGKLYDETVLIGEVLW